MDKQLKDVATVSSAKEKIRALKKQKEEALAAPTDKTDLQLKKFRKQIKRLKRLTRALARKPGPKGGEQPGPAASGESPAASG